MCVRMRALAILCVILSISNAFGYDRELHSDINPQCIDCNSKNITFLYVKGIGENDTIHNIWDFTFGKPTILFALTENNNTLNVTWNGHVPSSVQFADQPKYSFGVIIDKIWEFDDVNNTGVINPDNMTFTKSFDTKGMLWERLDLVEEEGEVMVTVRSKSFSNGRHSKSGNITIKLDLYPYTSYAFELPHLIHSANSSLVDIILQNMTTSTEFNHSRFALELLFVSTEKKNGSIDVNIRKGLDDEHTPGIFEIMELSTPQTVKNGDGGFIQFRPVSYTDPQRDVSTSTEVHLGALSPGEIPINSTADFVYRNFNEEIILLKERAFVCLGGKGDGYYRRSLYNIWSFTMGYGSPPLEGFSLFVILIISIGLGIPVFLMLLGGVYVCIKRRRKLDNEPEILIEDSH